MMDRLLMSYLKQKARDRERKRLCEKDMSYVKEYDCFGNVKRIFLGKERATLKFTKEVLFCTEKTNEYM